MKVYKEKQFLIFDFEDGNTVKYDFATKTCIGKSGKVVKNLCTQLRGISLDEVFEGCTDVQYRKFLKFVQREGDYYGRGLSNIGTILNRVSDFSNYEQLFSAGIEDIIGNKFKYNINEIPKGLIKLCRENNLKISNMFLEFYRENPDAYTLAYNLEYITLDNNDVYKILTSYESKQVRGGYWWRYENICIFNKLIKEYNYNAKALLLYIDQLKTFEALEDTNWILKELYDYVEMMSKLSPKFDKYPRHFLTTHKIACRNYNRLKQQFIEEDFQKRINKDMERTFGDYRFIYPDSTQDIKDESVAMNNCVSSYINKVISGECDILFLRKKDKLDKSLVTIEVRNNKIVQALQRYNHPLTKEQSEVVELWNKWWSNKLNNNKREEMKYVS